MNPRFNALKRIHKHSSPAALEKKQVCFGEDTFDFAQMRKMLSREIASHLKEVVEGKGKLNPKFAGSVADAMRQWAMERGATHFCHWFQPLTGSVAEKHDAFIDWKGMGELIVKFSGSHLMRGEPDASSFPHGGLRSTAEARGYTVWDPTSFAFLWGMGADKVLCIPSIFFSWKSEALDHKIPLMRSEHKISSAVLRLLNLFDIKADAVYSTLGPEQEYFLIDRSYYLLRPDLMLSGRTLCGSAPAKGQELEDHYFATIKERVSAFAIEVEQRALALGIPLRTRHAEVAPAQFEFAPLFERSSVAVDHNLLLMELMKQVAGRHHLACLIHEKPFARINGSGKHCNFSLATDTGLNLLSPDQPQVLFLLMLTAVIHAVYQHAELLRVSIATAGNDHRLGGNEAPPAIISVYLGHALEKWIQSVQEDKAHQAKGVESLNLNIPPIPDIALDETDRNRTSPFAFTGNKFEFRAVGASQNCAFPMTVLNGIIAQSLHQIVNDIEKELLKKKPLESVAVSVARKYLKASAAIRFTGDNYSANWRREAKKRKLPMIEKSAHAFDVLISEKSIKAFEGILSKAELESRVEILHERYCKTMHIEALLLEDLFRTHILPVSMQYQKEIAESIRFVSEGGHSAGDHQILLIKKLTSLINQAIEAVHLLEKQRQKTTQAPHDKRTLLYVDVVSPHTEALRHLIDELETLVDDRLWPLPKYTEMLHIL